jgi:hypothetical protein
MIAGQATATVAASPDEVLDFFCDPERYRHADTKIRRVLAVTPDGDDLIVRFRSRLRGLPAPAVSQRVHRTPGRVDVSDVACWQNRFVTFTAFAPCQPTAEGTQVTHREEFHFHGPLRPLLERYLGTWIASDVQDEVGRLRDILSPGAAASPRP